MTRVIVIILLFSQVLPHFAFSKANSQPKVLLGIDVLIREEFKSLLGKRIALLCNSASRSSTGKLTVEYFVGNPNLKLTAIFTPEHGFFTSVPAGRYVPDDSLYGVPIFSLYGNNRKPTPYQMSFADVIVVDLQDIGVRSYTFISTLYKVMEAASEANIPVVVLDRPNPLGGLIVDGNVLEKDKISFVGIIPIPYIHGCTIGEIAIMINEEGWLKSNGVSKKCDLSVIKMLNWRREMVWEDTGLQWYQTSPNIRTVDAIRGIAMLGALGELRLFNIGVGTSNPFQIFFSHNLNYNKLKRILSELKFEGVDFKEEKIYNERSKNYEKGFFISFDPKKNIKYYSYGMTLLFELRKVFPNLFLENKIKGSAVEMFKKVTGTEAIFDYLLEGNERMFKISLNKGLDEFLSLRSKYLLYK